jgi:hypothetical protein
MLYIVDILYDIVDGIANDIVFIRFISINVVFSKAIIALTNQPSHWRRRFSLHQSKTYWQ